jgi:SAM-dependent methyltransferase
MLGMHIAGSYPFPQRWIYRLFGFPNIHDRQRWALLSPQLSAYRGRPIRLLDFGCGSGYWVLELAASNPEWSITGVDRNPDLIRQAEERRRALGIRNARFAHADCLDWDHPESFDVVLSVNSAHYALPLGRGPELFRQFRRWLDPAGVLILLAPWCISERGRRVADGVDSPSRGFVSPDQVQALCAAAGLEIDTMTPCIGPLGILAKELALDTENARIIAAALYPAQLLLSFLDRRRAAAHSQSAAMILKATPIGAGKTAPVSHGTSRASLP